MDLSIVIVNWNTRDLLRNCLTSIADTVTGLDYEVFVVDNASADDSVAMVREQFPSVIVIANDTNRGFAAANNLAFRRMQGRYALLLNSDTVLTDGAISTLFGFMEENSEVGMCCGQLLNEDGSRQNSIANFPSVWPLLCNETLLRLLLPAKFPSKRQVYSEPVEVDSCIGACMLVRKAAMDVVGLLDERFFFYFEETDWAYRFKKAGWRICLVPQARIYHLQGKSVGYSAKARIMFHRSRSIYFKKWHPGQHGVMIAVIFARTVINILLNLLGGIFTLGMQRGIRQRLAVNAQLAWWYLRGCPAR
ncbi:MAG: glycosyltransferase family 2 protein [Desulfobulbaceae bacterium]|nr:glycosyltransferase family 2 protein [Desulfobulbaceae bacterium]